MLKPTTKRRRRPQAVVALPVVAAVVQPVAKRLSRIEALLLEMRFEQDILGKRLNALKEQLELLSERRMPERQRPRHDEKRRARPANTAALPQLH